MVVAYIRVVLLLVLYVFTLLAGKILMVLYRGLMVWVFIRTVRQCNLYVINKYLCFLLNYIYIECYIL